MSKNVICFYFTCLNCYVMKYILSREDTEWMSCNKNKVVYNRVKMKHSQQQDCLPSWIENLPDFKAGQNLKTLKREKKKKPSNRRQFLCNPKIFYNLSETF